MGKQFNWMFGNGARCFATTLTTMKTTIIFLLASFSQLVSATPFSCPAPTTTTQAYCNLTSYGGTTTYLVTASALADGNHQADSYIALNMTKNGSSCNSKFGIHYPIDNATQVVDTCTVTVRSVDSPVQIIAVAPNHNATGRSISLTADITSFTPAPTCTLTALPATISPGGTSLLTASCSSTTSYGWSSNTGFPVSVSSGTVSPSATTTYTVTGGNSFSGTGNTASVTVTVTPIVSAQVVEFYNTNLDNYFITADASEASQIDNGGAGPGWIRTGNTFTSGGSSQVCRFYGSSLGPNSHFYTADAGECAYLKSIYNPAAKSWKFESNDFQITSAVNGTCPSGTVPVYRAYNNGSTQGVDSNHRISTNLTAINQQVMTCGWKNEGVVMCATSGTTSGGTATCGTPTPTPTPTAVDGKCGSSNGSTVATAPTTNLCTKGTASGVSGTGPWTWTCQGSNGGANASCSANKTAGGGAGGTPMITAGLSHTCALTSGGGVKCWGNNWEGQLGDGSRTDRWTPVDVNGLTSSVIAISAGADHTCALTNGGGVKCWGYGVGTTYQLTPVDISGLTNGVIAISAGGSSTCALTSGGGVKCWDYGSSYVATPMDVSGLSSGVIAISASANHTCALTSGGGVKCWGYNDYGALGDGSTTRRLIPVDVNGLTSGVIAISTGGDHTCALTSGGAVKCWGDYTSPPQCGDCGRLTQVTPVDVLGLTSGVSAIAAGGFGHICVLTSGGGVKCWGKNYDGELGDGSRTNRRTPVDVSGLTIGVSGIAVSSAINAHTCALISGGGVKCWGYNWYGQLGDGSNDDPVSHMRLTPVDVLGLTLF